ncbi:hypothetical protein [Pseudanabaena sp. FACHB-2040]|uniref:hypothetical protein n=1 Tax=Pseudanabaena sp. FACHB-2040 TaxID=2692859 RepID=UPI00168708FB|nr:hypothetical protein [Pseudanabaena sp. FACHB-2040]MBD2258387.1 hypothetical protein [Pseudanabaena sp. FACHB-2040]
MIRKLSASLIALTLVWSSVACSSLEGYSTSQPAPQLPQETTAPAAVSSITDGVYPVQQATYDDSLGEYSLILLNTEPGQSLFRSANLPLARLTDEEISAGKLSELRVEQGQPALYLTPDFRIEYVHNVTETQIDPQSGQEEVVIVRQEPSFWTPFAGALAGQVVGNLLFRPQYYLPPVYRPGIALVGYGGYGRNYNEAVSRYQSRYQAPPAEYRNRQFRASGRLRSTNGNAPRVNTNRPSGSGFGNSNLRRNNRRTERARPSGGGFGSSRPRRSAPRRGFGGRRR